MGFEPASPASSLVVEQDEHLRQLELMKQLVLFRWILAWQAGLDE